MKEFAEFFVNTLGEMVAPATEEAFYKPQRLDHNGKPIKQDSKVAKVDAKKVKPVMSVVGKKPSLILVLKECRIQKLVLSL